jgi:hypothetical protein
MDFFWRMNVFLLFLLILLAIPLPGHLIMTNPQPFRRGGLNKVTLGHIQPLHMQEVQHFHYEHFLDSVRMRQVNPTESLNLLNLELDRLVLLLQVDFCQFVLVL